MSSPAVTREEPDSSRPGRSSLVSVCVCTRNRPSELERCLDSIERSGLPVHEVIVSDDSDDYEPARSVCAGRPSTTWLAGPRRGLCANRNNALARVSGGHVLMLDDDALLETEFLGLVTSRLRAISPSRRDLTIVTGRELRPGGHLTAAREQSFLGFQRRRYCPGDRHSTVVINAALFPSSLFERVAFDERLRYGYDEVDLTTRAVALGYEILSVPEAVNRHEHSQINRSEYAPVVDASRLYVTLKRLVLTERRPLRAATFAVVAPLHLVAASIKRSGVSGLPGALSVLKMAAGHVRAGLRHAPEPPLGRSGDPRSA